MKEKVINVGGSAFISGDINTNYDINKILSSKEKELLYLQREYIDAIDKYYNIYPPFTKDNSNRLPEEQDIDCYLRLIRQAMDSNNVYLLHKWGVDYAIQQNVLAKPKEFYKEIFRKFSEPNNCLRLEIGIMASAYFRYLYENFPSD